MITSYRKADISFKWIKDLEEQGCFSRVYLAHDENLDHDLVIKEIKKSESKDGYSGNPVVRTSRTPLNGK